MKVYGSKDVSVNTLVEEQIAKVKRNDRAITYKGYKLESNEGRMVAEMQDVISVLETLYAEALADAGENFQAASEEPKKYHPGGLDERTGPWKCTV